MLEFEAEPGRDLGIGTIYDGWFTLLHYVCVEDEPELVNVLIEAGADMKHAAGAKGKRGAEGVTPWDVACGNSNESLMADLLDKVSSWAG